MWRGQQLLREALDELQEMPRLAHDKADGRPHLGSRRVFGPLFAAVGWTCRRLQARRRTRWATRGDGVQPPGYLMYRVSGALPAAVGGHAGGFGLGAVRGVPPAAMVSSRAAT